MAALDKLLVADAQDSCTSLSDVIWDFDYQGSGAYNGPAARELSSAPFPIWLCSITGRPPRTALSWTAGSNRSSPIRPASGDGIRGGHRARGNPG